jgi:hypothetical protein
MRDVSIIGSVFLLGSLIAQSGCMVHVPEKGGTTPAGAAPAAAPAPTAAPAPAPVPAPGSGEFRPGVHMSTAVARVLVSALNAERKTNLGFDRGVTFMGAFLRPQAFINWGLKLQAGTSYAFLGGGDDGATDVDLTVLNAAGLVVARDQLTDAKPAVAFTPVESGSYTVRVTLSRASRASFCALAVMRQSGFTVPVNNMTTALKKIMAAGRLASQRASVRFHEERNQWALFGAVLRPGDTSTISGLNLEGRQHVFLAAGDANARVIELALQDQFGNLVKRDPKPDSVAVVVANTPAGRYRLVLTNSQSTGPALIAAVILDVI